MFFVGRAVKTSQNIQNGPKISCGTHLLLECCMMIGLLGWGKARHDQSSKPIKHLAAMFGYAT